MLPHVPYSPDLAPSDHNLFRSMQHRLLEQLFHSYKEIKNWIDESQRTHYKKFYEVYNMFQCCMKIKN